MLYKEMIPTLHNFPTISKDSINLLSPTPNYNG